MTTPSTVATSSELSSVPHSAAVNMLTDVVVRPGATPPTLNPTAPTQTSASPSAQMSHDVGPEKQQSHAPSAEESPDSTSRPKKKRSFLRIPSRSSSSKKQKEPSSEDPSQGDAAGSSTSLSNTVDKRRNSKASSKRSRDAQHAPNASVQVEPKTATRETDSSNPDAESKAKRPSKFLSFLSCCASSGDDSDESPLPPKESAKSQSIRTRQASIEKPETTSSEPVDPDAKAPRTLNESVNSNLSAEQSTSKAEHQVAVPGGTAANKSDMHQQAKAEESASSPVPTRNEISRPAPAEAVEEPEKSQALPADTTPLNQPVIVENVDTSANRHQTQLESVSEQPDEKEDSAMRGDVPTPVEEEAVAESQHEITQQQTSIPPPPPLSQPTEAELPPVPSMQPDNQEWLLPPIEPRFQNRKCLVLDLDETLVHSSFKVLPSYHHPVLLHYGFTNTMIGT